MREFNINRRRVKRFFSELFVISLALLITILTVVTFWRLLISLVADRISRRIQRFMIEESRINVRVHHIKLYMPDEYIFDSRVFAIKRLYGIYKSPLGRYAMYMVKVSDKYGIDWKLIPAISIVESTGGRFNFRPYNAWGLMTGKNFRSYYESIDFVGRLLASSYRRGCRSVYCISRWYCPPTYKSWAGKVKFVMKQLNNL